jgi:hypothetical protein
MAYLGAGLIVLAILVVLARAFVAADTRALVRAIRYLIGGVLVVVGVGLSFAERIGIGVLLISAGLSIVVTGRLGPLDLGGHGRRSPGSSSTVRSRFFEMSLDHDSGALRGRVVAGHFAGRELDELDDADLLKLAAEIAGDQESAALFEAYLDRRMPGWRDHVEADAAAGTRGAPDAGTMTDEEAYQVLGLAPGAGDREIRAAHRRLMMRMHPDQGGSTFLAAKINQAKDRLLGKHR